MGSLVGTRNYTFDFLCKSTIEVSRRSEMREVCRRCFVTCDRCKLFLGETRDTLTVATLTPFACYRVSLLGSVTWPTCFILCLLARSCLLLSPRGKARAWGAPLLDS